MRRLVTTPLVALALAALGAPAPGAAQDRDAAPLQPGAVAPDFSLPGAVRHGVLAEPVSLRGYEGKTVVLAVFFRARTRG